MSRRVSSGVAIIVATLCACKSEEASGAAPASRLLEPGVRVLEATTATAGGVQRSFWLYTPDPVPAQPLPLVVIAAAGSNLFTGIGLGEGDRPEHLPYVRAGYAVVAYSVDGAIPKDGSADASDLIRGVRSFVAARAGVADTTAAIDFATGKINVDRARIYAVGHSSAATLALLSSSQEKRIRGVVAFAPVTDVVQRLGSMVSDLDQVSPGAASLLQWSSPAAHLAELTMPVLLFCAKDDDVVPHPATASFAVQLKAKNASVTLVEVPTGGHYDSTTREGIPAALRWLASVTTGTVAK